MRSEGKTILVDTGLGPGQHEFLRGATGDLNGALASATRKNMMDGLVEEGHIAAFCHFPGEGFGRIVESNGKRVFQAL